MQEVCTRVSTGLRLTNLTSHEERSGGYPAKTGAARTPLSLRDKTPNPRVLDSRAGGVRNCHRAKQKMRPRDLHEPERCMLERKKTAGSTSSADLEHQHTEELRNYDEDDEDNDEDEDEGTGHCRDRTGIRIGFWLVFPQRTRSETIMTAIERRVSCATRIPNARTRSPVRSPSH